MYLNIFSLTLRFIDTGCPFSSSNPASPPSPARPAILSCRSRSSWACVLCVVEGFSGEVVWVSGGEASGFFAGAVSFALLGVLD